MSDEEEVIHFDEDDEDEDQKQNSIRGSKISQLSNQQTKANKLAPPPPNHQSTLKEPKTSEIVSQDGPMVNFSKLFKKSKEQQLSQQTNSLKVESGSDIKPPKQEAQPQKSMFLKAASDQSQFIIEDADAEPAIIKLEDPEFQEEEEDVLVIDKNTIGKAKKLSDIEGEPNRMTVKKAKQVNQATIVQDEIFDKFEGKSVDDSSASPKIFKQSTKQQRGGTTEPFPASDENRNANIDTIFSQSISIGMQSQDSKQDFYGISSHTTRGSLWTTAFSMAIKKAYMNPMLPFVTLLAILDATLTSISQWYFLAIYAFLLATVPVYFWHKIYRLELELEYKFDRQAVLVYDFNLAKFVNRSVCRLYNGCIILLRKGDRIPGPMLMISSDGSDYAQVLYGEQIRTYAALAKNIQESDLNYLDGKLEFNELPIFANESKARLRLDLVEPIDLLLTEDDKITENGIVDSIQLIGILLPASQKQKYYKESLSFNMPLFLNPLNAEFFSIGLALFLAITLSIAGVVWSKENSDKHLYIRETSGYNFFQMIIDHLIVYATIVPVFIEILRPLFLLIARMKINDDQGMDPERSEQLCDIKSYFAIDNLASTKFVNYSNVLNEPRLKVCKASFIGGPIQEEDVKLSINQKDPYELKPKDHEEIHINRSTKYDVIELDHDAQCDDKARSTFIYERVLLTLPYTTLDPTQLAIKKYCHLGECVNFSYTDKQRSVLLPKDILRVYQLKLVIQNPTWNAYLYQLPPYEQEEEDSDDEDANDLQQLQDRIKKDRELFERINSNKYMWVVQAEIDAPICKEHPQLATFNHGRVFFEYEMDETEFKKLAALVGKDNFFRKYASLPQYAEEMLFSQAKPIAVFEFDTLPQNNFHLLLDLNLAIIRQWFFVKDIEMDDTLNCLRQYMECIEFTKDDLHNEIQNMKSQSIPILKQSLREFKVFDNLYKIDDKYITLIVNGNVLDAAIADGDLRGQFLECLMIASFVVFEGLNKHQIDYLMIHQREQAKSQTIVAFGRSDEDLTLCRTNTIRVCVACQVKERPSMYSQLCHAEFVNVDCLSKLILTHARQTHMRTAGFLLFQLYKGFLITMCEFFFSFFNGYSSQQLFTVGFHFMFQTFFTSLYGFLLYSFYSDVNHRIIRIFAGEFIKCQRDYFFNRKKLILIFIDSLYQGFIIFYLPASILQYANNEEGIIEGFYYISLVSFLTVTLTVQLQPVLYFPTICKEQVLTLIFNFSVCIIAMMTTCSNDQWLTNIPQYMFHLESILNSIKSVFIIIFLAAICLTPTVIIQQYETIADSQLIRMIHYFEDKEEQEELEKEKEKGNKQKDKNINTINETQQEKQAQHHKIEHTIEQSADPINMSSDQLIAGQ